KITKALVARDDWPAIDAVLLPGGFFRLRSAIGGLDDHGRRSLILDTKAARFCVEASRQLEQRSADAVL
ncbi:hypothetical protein, partial [Klebsiella variicola]|uniref:hypothetical protein n=1 Tax=Klebsiella variicola TaxID=244366 RepID=UPI0019531E42